MGYVLVSFGPPHFFFFWGGGVNYHLSVTLQPQYPSHITDIDHKGKFLFKGAYRSLLSKFSTKFLDASSDGFHSRCQTFESVISIQGCCGYHIQWSCYQIYLGNENILSHFWPTFLTITFRLNTN